MVPWVSGHFGVPSNAGLPCLPLLESDRAWESRQCLCGQNGYSGVYILGAGRLLGRDTHAGDDDYLGVWPYWPPWFLGGLSRAPSLLRCLLWIQFNGSLGWHVAQSPGQGQVKQCKRWIVCAYIPWFSQLTPLCTSLPNWVFNDVTSVAWINYREVFTPRKSTNAINQGFLPPWKPVVK